MRAKYEREDRPLGEGVATVRSQYLTRGMLRRDRLRSFVFRATKPVTGIEHEVLALRMPRDEASLGLTLAGLFAAVADATWAMIDGVVRANARLTQRLGIGGPLTARKKLIMLSSMLLAIGTVFATATWFPHVLVPGLILAAVFAIPALRILVQGLLAQTVSGVVAVSLAPPLLSLAGVLLAPFGLELILCGLLAKVRAAEKPEVPCRVVMLKPEGRGLRHAVYHSPAARLELSSWIQSQQLRQS
jgi:hypothetical protein